MFETLFEASLKRRLGLIAALALACLPGTTVAQDVSVPVIAGQIHGYDACGLVGVVRGLDPRGDGFLAVRAGPGSNYAMLDKVYSDQLLTVCDDHGKWLGVVYSHETEDCGVSTPWPGPAAYTGPCRSSWVYRTYVKDFAG
jgi:hypothetical protein